MVQAADALNLDSLKERDDAARVPADSTQSEESDALALVIAQATAPIVASLHKALALGLVLAFAIIFAIGFCIYLYNRMPDLVLIREDQDGRRVVLNNREFGAVNNVELRRDQVTDRDKIYAASKFIHAIYNVTPATRDVDIERAITQMVPANAMKLSQYLEPFLAEQRRDNWQAVWNEQSAYIDPNDPQLVHIIGEQKITKLVGNAPVTETKQFNLAVKLMYDRPMANKQHGNPRAERNLNSGFLVVEYKGDEIQKAN